MLNPFCDATSAKSTVMQQHLFWQLFSSRLLSAMCFPSYTFVCIKQRWASTLANRSNARHRSNIRAPPRPLPPDICFQSVGICVARGAGSDLQLAGVLGCYIFVPAPHAPPPKGRGQRSKVVILPTTGHYKVVSSWTPPIIPNDRIDEPLSRRLAISSFLFFPFLLFSSTLY